MRAIEVIDDHGDVAASQAAEDCCHQARGVECLEEDPASRLDSQHLEMTDEERCQLGRVYIYVVTELPHTHSGKIDRQRVPEFLGLQP